MEHFCSSVYNNLREGKALNATFLVLCVRTVQVIKLISKDSIEDAILQLSQKKLKLEQDMTAAEQSK